MNASLLAITDGRLAHAVFRLTHAVFRLAPADLLRMTGGQAIKVT